MLINSILYKPGADFNSFLAVLKAWLQGLGNPGHCGVFLGKTDQTKRRNESLSPTRRTSLTEHHTRALAGILPSFIQNHRASGARTLRRRSRAPGVRLPRPRVSRTHRCANTSTAAHLTELRP